MICRILGHQFNAGKRLVGMWIFYVKFNVILDTFKSRTCYQVIKDKWFSVILKSPINVFSTSVSKDRKFLCH